MVHALLVERQEFDLNDLMAAQDGEAVAAHIPREPGRRATPGRPGVDFLIFSQTEKFLVPPLLIVRIEN